MPIGYAVAPEQRVVFIRAWGVLTEADVSTLVDAMRSDSSISPDWSSLADLREVESFAIGGAFLRGFQSPFSVTARRAMIASSRESHAVVQMFVLERNLTHVGVFDGSAAALEWLGLPPATKLPEPSTTFGQPANN